MLTRKKGVYWALVIALVFGLVPAYPSIALADDGPVPLFAEDFAAPGSHWDGTAWSVEQDADTGSAAGKLTSSSGAYPTSRVKPAVWTSYAATNDNYKLEFKAKYSDAAAGAPKYFRVFFRYDTTQTGVNHYYFEFRQGGNLVYFGKYVNGVDTRIGNGYTISDKIAGFSFQSWHQYEVIADGAVFRIAIDGVPIGKTESETTHARGTVGFGLKNAVLSVDDVRVTPFHEEPPIEITHTPIASAYYNTDAPGAFTVPAPAAGVAVNAVVSYRYGTESYRTIDLPPSTDGAFSFVIPGTNRASAIGYYLTVTDSAGHSGRYPASGEQTIAVKPFNRFFDNFESTPAGQLPVDWFLRGIQPNIAVYDDGGNHVLRFAGAATGNNWTAKFVNPLYRNIDHFKVSFRAKYKVTNPDPHELYNVWRLSYRDKDTFYNTMEWGSHNTKYIMFKRTPLGGVDNGSYYRSVPEEWHRYEVEVAGITHTLSIDGQTVIRFDDASEDAPDKGFLQFTTVNGLELLIDDFEITPVTVPYVYNVEPYGNFVGIYESGEPLGLTASVQAGAAEQTYRVSYRVTRADGAKEEVAAGQREFTVPAYEKRSEAILFEPNVAGFGVYDVTSELYINGVKADDKTKTLRVAVIKQAAAARTSDLSMESKFGFNINYDLATKDDLIDSVRTMGVRHGRFGLAWPGIDTNGGIYNYEVYDPIIDAFASRGINPIPILGIKSNGVYDNGEVVDNRGGLEALRSFMADLVQHYEGKVRYWEMPNEPELETHPYIPQELVQVQKAAYSAMKKTDLNAVLIAGAHTSGVTQILPGELELGSYNYADAFSYHRYTYGVMPDGFVQKQYEGVRKLIDGYGGWKDLYVTESGWPTATNGYPSVSQEVQRDYAVRGFLIDMISDQVRALEHFNWRDSGFDANFYNTNFGITDGNGRPKLAYPALQTLMTTLDRARYVGTLQTGDESVEAHLFLNGNEPVLVLWKKVNYGGALVASAPKSTIALPVDSAQVTVIDVYGREASIAASGGQATLTVSGTPMFVKGFGAALTFASAGQLQAKKKTEAAAKLEALRTGGNGAAIDGALGELNRIHGALASALSSAQPAGRSAGIEQGAKDLYALMTRVANLIRDGAVDRVKGDVALEALYNDAEYAATALIEAKRQEGGQPQPAIPDYGSAVAEARSAYDGKIGPNGLMPVSTSAMMRANRYAEIAAKSASEGYAFDAYGYGVMAKELAQVVEAIVESEPVIPVDVTMSASPVNGEIESGGSLPVIVSLTNRSSQTKTVTLNLAVPSGWGAAQTEQATRTVTLAAGAAQDVNLALQAPIDASPGIFYAQLDLAIGGVPSDLIKIKLNATSAVRARLMPVAKSPGELDIVNVRLTGTSQAPKSGKVILKGPDGQTLEPVVPGGDAYSIVYGQTVDVPFKWTYGRTRPFHEYVGSLEVTDQSAANRVIYRDAAVPLDFLIVQKAKPTLAIDGDLSDWIDAYPIHMRGAERNANGVYEPNNLDAVMYAKWDESNLYFALEVTDDIHKAAEPPSGIWKNDAVQFAIDPLNDKGGTYRDDDIDFGLALNDFGQQLGFVFQAQPPNATGDISSAIPYRIVRDEAHHKTYYEAKIPGDSIVKALGSRLHLGGEIGFNAVVPDSDLQDGRQNYIGWTKGIAESKNPGLYDTFTFVDVPFALPDETPPAIVITPIGSIAQTQTLLVNVAATDLQSGISQVKATIDGKPISVPVKITPLSLRIGTHTLEVRAKDAAGNEAVQTAVFTVTISLGLLDDVIGMGAAKGWIKGDAVTILLLAQAAVIQRTEKNRADNLKSLRLQVELLAAAKKIDAAFAVMLKEDLVFLENLYRKK
ncbi:sugar-binding protein [Cohnella faecalis]|uniref:Carbohydrate-binding domain-containing protein n=1 Tax=Cohnella faecalis TaxID=2315694 RepID=A0A398CPS7_9BACL|nr:sugar-binding protein [Cohnella faecalis]RIE04553.1 hypothetical protein D3H35_05520 [Cohnella faecalis]